MSVEPTAPATAGERSRHRRRRRLRADALAATGVGAVALVAALAALAPFAERYRDSLAPNLQDPLFYVYVLSWGARQLALGLPDFWSAGFFHPEPDALALSDAMPGPAAVAWALEAIGVGQPAAYNLLVLASFPLTACSLFVLLRRAGVRRASAAVGAWGYTFAPFRWLHLEHLQMLWIPALALVVWAWDRLLERLTFGRAAGFLALYALHFTGGLYLAYMIHLPLAAIAVMRARPVIHQLARRSARWAMLVAVVGAALVAYATFLPYLEAAERGYRRTEGDMAIWGATLASFVTPSRANLYFPHSLQGLYRFENALFPGILVAVALALWALRLAPRARVKLAAARWPVLLAVGLAVVAVALALGDLATWTGREHVTLLGYSLRIRGYSRPALLLGIGAVVALVGYGRGPGRLRLGGGRRSRPLSSGSPRYLRRALLCQGAVATALCLPLVSAPLSRLVPGLLGIRAPSRFAGLALLASALLVAAAASTMARRLPVRRRGAAVVCLGLLLLLPELVPRSFDWQRIGRRESFPAVYHELARRGLDGAVVEVPFPEQDLRSELVRMWHSTLHWNPTSAGYSGYYPMSYLDLRSSAAREPPERLLARLRSLGFLLVIVHLDQFPEAARDRVEREWEDPALPGARRIWRDPSTLLLEIGPSARERAP